MCVKVIWIERKADCFDESEEFLIKGKSLLSPKARLDCVEMSRAILHDSAQVLGQFKGDGLIE